MQRRKLLAESSPRLGEAGRAFLQAGRWGEALECLDEAGDSGAIEELLQAAVKDGDLFYARAAAKALGRELDQAQLTAVAEAAGRAGKAKFEEAARAASQDQS